MLYPAELRARCCPRARWRKLVVWRTDSKPRFGVISILFRLALWHGAVKVWALVNCTMGRRFMQQIVRQRCRLLGLAFGLVFSLLVSPQPLLAAETRQALAPKAMVAAANPLAVEAGLGVLRRGGSAVDAAVAVQAVLGLVEPQSSGLGGGAFMVYYNAKSGAVMAYDGREIAPAGAGPDMFLQTTETGAVQPMGFAQAVLSGRSTGVPGAVAMLALAQSQQGKLAWKDLFGDGMAMEGGKH